MRKYLITVLLLAVSMTAWSQKDFTDVLQQRVEGEGCVNLHQSQTITDLVNGKLTAGQGSDNAPTTVARQKRDTVAVDTETVPQQQKSGVRRVMNGYRIQVYLGDNTRKGKNEARMMGQRVKSYFMELPVYVHFVSPHWLCRVGNFTTYEEANEYFRQMRETGRFPEAVIVKSKVSVRL